MESWIDKEIADSTFKDKRLTARFHMILTKLSSGDGRSIPQMCEDWAMTKATYRFLSNERVEENEILSGHFGQTTKRVSACRGPVLILHDTCEFTYKRENPDEIGTTRKSKNPNKFVTFRNKEYKVCGLLMHASLAVSEEGLPLGVTSVRFWTRKTFKNTTQMKRHVNPTRIPIEKKESIRWLQNLESSNDLLLCDPSKLIHIGDRECDIYEFFRKCTELNSFYLVRTCVNRLADEATVAEIVALKKGGYRYNIEFIDADGEKIKAKLIIKVKSVTLHPPIGKEKLYPDLKTFVISASEIDVPVGREAICWNFVTNLPITSREQAIQAVNWYKQRWKIESFFKILKSGFRAEASKLRTAQRLARLIAILCILAWRVHWITFLGREGKKIHPKAAFDALELHVIASFYKKSGRLTSLNEYIVHLARLGGYLARKDDSPPGNMVIWRGLSRLQDLKLGFELRSG